MSNADRTFTPDQLANRASAGTKSKDELRQELAGLPINQQVERLLQQNRQALEKAIPQHLTIDRLMRVAVTAIQQTPLLKECTLMTLVGSIVTAAQLGLEVNTPLGHAYLVPFWNSKRKLRECQLIIGYKGFVDLLYRSPKIKAVAAYPVYHGETFDFELGTSGYITHKPNEEADTADANVRAFYCVIELTTGGKIFEVMWDKAIRALATEQIKKSQFGRSPWATDYVAMGRKTPLRRLVKYAPMGAELARAVAIDEAGERGETQGVDDFFEGEFDVMPESANQAPNGNQSVPDERTGEPSADDGGKSWSVDELVEAAKNAKTPDELDQVADLVRTLRLMNGHKARVEAAIAARQGEMNQRAQGAGQPKSGPRPHRTTQPPRSGGMRME